MANRMAMACGSRPARRLVFIAALGLALVLCVTGCYPLFPSDPAQGMAATRVDGMPVAKLPACYGDTLKSLEVHDGSGQLIWGIYADPPVAVAPFYVLGAQPDGYTSKGSIGPGSLQGKTAILAEWGDGGSVSTSADFSKISDSLLYINGHVMSVDELNSQIFCGNGKVFYSEPK
jgi:hypothetical protein